MEDLKFEVSEETKGKDLHNFIKYNMPFNEVIDLYMLLTSDIKQIIDFANKGDK